MKRFALLLVCAAVCLGVLAAPALAGKKVQTYRPPTDTPIVWDAWWWEYSPSTGEFADEATFYQAFDPDDPDFKDWFRAVPKDGKVKLMAMWIGVGYGFMSNAPKNVLFTYDVTGPNGYSKNYGPATVKAHWTGPYVWDKWWNDFYQWFWMTDWTPTPFNPAIGAGVYGNNVMLPVGPFPEAGKYTVTESWWTARPVNEMLYLGDPARPTHTAAGGQGWLDYSFDMYVE